MELYQVDTLNSDGNWQLGVVWQMESCHFRNFLTMFYENIPPEQRENTRIRPIFHFLEADLTFDGKQCVEIPQAERFIKMQRRKPNA